MWSCISATGCRQRLIFSQHITPNKMRNVNSLGTAVNELLVDITPGLQFANGPRWRVFSPLSDVTPSEQPASRFAWRTTDRSNTPRCPIDTEPRAILLRRVANVSSNPRERLELVSFLLVQGWATVSAEKGIAGDKVFVVLTSDDGKFIRIAQARAVPVQM
jgi:hypothetical protein